MTSASDQIMSENPKKQQNPNKQQSASVENPVALSSGTKSASENPKKQQNPNKQQSVSVENPMASTSWRAKRKRPLHIAEEFVEEGTDPPWCERRFIDQDIGNARLSHFFV